MKPFFRLAVVAVLLMTFSSALAGTAGKIAGRIIDQESKEPLPGVSVQIIGTTTGAATNIQGEFFIINVPPGSHTLKASLVGYGPVEVKNVVVSVDLTTTIDFELSTQTIDMGTITVEAVRPLIEKDITSSRATIAPTQITDSAVDGLINAAALTAGAVVGSFRGGRQNEGEVIYMIDGVNLSNPIGSSHRGYSAGDGTQALATTLPNEAVAEAEVLTGGFGAEYPNVQSAVVNVVTKEGGSKYSGKIKSKASPEILLTSDSIEDDVFHIPFFANPDDPTDTLDDGSRRLIYQDFTVQRDKVDEYNRSDYYDMRQHEFSFGGPVPIPSIDLPGKMSFYTSGIYTYRRSYRDFNSYTRSKSIHGKISYDLTSSKKITVSGLLAEGDRRNWNHNRMLTLTWGEPTYYHRKDVDLATNSLIYIDTFYTPYHFIYASGYGESNVVPALVDYWISLYGDETWTADDVQQYFDDNFGVAYSNWATMPDSIREGAAQYIESLGWARRYENYNMSRSLGDPETRSNEFHVNFTNNLSSKSFYKVSYSRFLTAQEAYTKDPWDGHPLGRTEFSDPRFSPIGGTIQSQQLVVSPMWLTTTMQNDRVVTQTFKGDFTSQVNSYNLIKFGAEVKLFDVLFDYHGFASGENEYTSYYHHKPTQFGIYAQDKIETEGMIVNAGLRYDYFDPKTILPFNPADPLNEGYDNVNDPRYIQTADLEARLKNFVSAKKKQQLSPRVGISHPITEKDVLHVTYGHYFQLPVFDDLYYNHAYDLRGAFKYIGNPNLNEQKTIAYEAGIEHGFNDYLKLSAVGFYKDIADLISNRKFRDPQTGGIFWINMNSDYARVKGFEFTLTQRPWNNISGTASYTYQIARGRASDPEQTFLDDYRKRKPRTEDALLDWDQPHTAKVNINYRVPVSDNLILGDWGFDVVWTFGSGRPYTGSENVVPPALPPINNERYPSMWQLDIRVDKGVNLYKNYNLNAFVEVQNVTDRADIDPTINFIDDTVVDLDMYEATGDPSGQFTDPTIYTAPRRILLGMQLSF
ncbi:MAG: TonB-dependent receptor [Candidatus Zixiibacteriota bacterium]|nr:MAG: TonB-dependent receptor [candidate division Zixibacteria bacterium]